MLIYEYTVIAPYKCIAVYYLLRNTRAARYSCRFNNTYWVHYMYIDSQINFKIYGWHANIACLCRCFHLHIRDFRKLFTICIQYNIMGFKHTCCDSGTQSWMNVRMITSFIIGYIYKYFIFYVIIIPHRIFDRKLKN